MPGTCRCHGAVFSPMDSLTPSFLFREEKKTSVWLSNDFLEDFCYFFFFFFLRFLNATLNDIHIWKYDAIIRRNDQELIGYF